MRRIAAPASALAAAGLLLLPCLAAPAHAADDEAPAPGATAPPPAAETPPAPLRFGDDYAAALEEARRTRRPVLLVAVPDWYESPAVKRLQEKILAGAPARERLEGFVRVLVKESPDREVHVRHRLEARGYPLAVVLDADGTFLGSVAGLPREDAVRAWPERVAAIPGRHQQEEALRARLREMGEDPATLLDLAAMLLEDEEPDRADALLVRLEAADPEDLSGKLGEARWLRLRIASDGALLARKFDEVEPLCLRWLRRFREHPRVPDVLLVQAGARFLAGRKDEARELWKTLVADHPGTAAAGRAQKALDGLKD